MTDYLAAAISKILIDTGGGCDLGEVKAQLPDYYNGPAVTDDQIVHELDVLVAGNVVYTLTDEDGSVFYYDNK